MADVVCRTLGFSSGQVKIDTEFGQGTGPIWMDDVHCSGNETDLFDCQHDGWGVHNCDHSEDIGVVCSNQSGKELDGSQGPTTCRHTDTPLRHEYEMNRRVHTKIILGQYGRYCHRHCHL